MTARLAAFVAAIAWGLAAGGALAAPREGVVRVNSVVVEPAASLAEAEVRAKRQALGEVLKMRGNKQLRETDVAKIMATVDSHVTTRLVLNKEPVGGRYQPAFYFNVAMAGIDEVIQQANAAGATAYGNPRIQVALIIRRLPDAFEKPDDREAFVDDVNTLASEYFNREGFSIVGFSNIGHDQFYKITKLPELEDAMFDPRNKPGAIDFFLLGQLDAPDGSVVKRDGGAFHTARIKLMLHFWDLNSGQVVDARRDVEGNGETARSALDEALKNVVKHIIQNANAPDVLKRWRRNMDAGMKYEVAFCEKELKYEYFKGLQKHLEGAGRLSGTKSEEVPLFELQFPPGSHVDPARELATLLESIQKDGRYTDTQVLPIVYNKHKVFMFGNSPNCFQGRRAQATDGR